VQSTEFKPQYLKKEGKEGREGGRGKVERGEEGDRQAGAKKTAQVAEHPGFHP
jgi:hypothetical protein